MFNAYARSSVMYGHLGHWSVVGSLVTWEVLQFCATLNLIMYMKNIHIMKRRGVVRWCSNFCIVAWSTH